MIDLTKNRGLAMWFLVAWKPPHYKQNVGRVATLNTSCVCTRELVNATNVALEET